MGETVGQLVASGYNSFIVSGAGPQAGRIAWTRLSGKCGEKLGCAGDFFAGGAHQLWCVIPPPLIWHHGRLAPRGGKPAALTA
jgi:hypothetical protein